jgi:hypothetical protein
MEPHAVIRKTLRSAVVLAVATALVLPVAVGQAESASAATRSSASWLSGASGTGVTNGKLGTWRGRSVDIAGTWSDNNLNAANFWQLQKGGDYANWNKPIDIAVGALDKGETWKRASTGAYDSRWVTSLKKLKSLRASTTHSTYIRFAHEMNGNWYPWSVNASNYKYFDAAWKRYRALQKKTFPKAKLVFSVNRESVGTGMSWTKFFPGRKYVDAMSVDYYNQYPYVASTAAWKKSLTTVDQWGAPKGLSMHLRFAKAQGLPIGISEWSGNASFGDSSAFVSNFLSYVRAHAGSRAGKIRYEILFNAKGYSGKFALYGADVTMHKSSSAYRSFFK